ncbi:MAG: FecR domain-containing protein [Verrucomicrobiaceae bacterium]|nr:FecR domain-containing protein [Verrucomicrobiaceae bacterium]
MKTNLFLIAWIAMSSFAAHGAAVIKSTRGQTNVKAQTALVDGAMVMTAAKSSAELALTNGVVRTGSTTMLRDDGKDRVTLQKGLAVVASRPRFFRPSLQVTTDKHLIKVKGTAQIYNEPGKALRIVVIEGSLSIALQSLSRERVTLRAGQVLVVDPVESAIPEPLEVDLDRLIESAHLLSARGLESLPTQDLVSRAVEAQEREQRSMDRGEGRGSGPTDDSGAFGASGDPAEDRTEEVVHRELADEIDDLDGDGEPDDDFMDDLDGEDDDDLDDDDGEDEDADPGDDDAPEDDGPPADDGAPTE